MEAFSFWKGDSFTPLEYLSLLSTSVNTSFSRITVYYDESDHPENHYWNLTDEIPRVHKEPAAERLEGYMSRVLSPGVGPIRDVRIVADIFRYAHLYDHGGAWFDLDMLHVKDLAALMAGREFTAGWESADYVNIGILGFPAGHPILEGLLASLDASLREEEVHFNTVGPPLMTRIVKEQGRESDILDVPYFYPIDYRRGDEVIFGRYPLTEQTHSIHVWAYVNRHHFENKSLDDFAGVESTFFDQVRTLLAHAD